ncbi:hypothetical protein FNH22_30905 [Fulvivirga sp. M361]|uniref:hypothetical protein n=1 Tax=Fulvivirga sp. M361 TaxID=2594266 RepID=UPI00117AFAF5|nr:hypothetical protein [Fulvivirga sp. M361]TRX46404.1 hypothetical protein FNH22_30905 [Fulvivirga sp. M361]
MYTIRKQITILASISMMIILGTSCARSPSEKLEESQTELAEASEDLVKAREDYLVDMKAYKIEIGEKIATNEERLKKFRGVRADYEQKINALETKNSAMKTKLDENKVEGKAQWDSFKAEFNQDMDELETALKDLTIKNSKE